MAPEGPKNRFAKAAGAEPAGQMRAEKLHAIVARGTGRSQKCKKLTVSDAFWNLRRLLEVEIMKMRAIVAQSTVRSQNVQSTPFSDHFRNLTCRKSARCCGAKHVSKSKVQKNWRVRNIFGRSGVVSRGRHKGLRTLSKVSKT